MPGQLQELQVVRVNGIMKGLQDARLIPAELKFLQRTPIVPATDQEIMGRFLGFLQIADLVADDAAAAVYSSAKLSFETYKIPNLKHGVNLTQEQLNQLLAIQQHGGIVGDDMGIVSDFEMQIIDGLLTGIRQRMEALCIASRIDGFSYDRLGIKMSNVTFGMPADLKVTPSIDWTNPTTMTPIDNILAVKLVGSTRYGITFDRVTMSTAAFRAAIASAEYQAKVRAYLAPNVSFAVISTLSLDQQKALMQNVLGMTIELYDSRYWSQQADGTLVSAPYLPVNLVIMEDSTNDNTSNAFDFANGICTETVVSSMAPTNMIGGFSGPQRGPISYATVPPDLNPPNITYWGVARGFSRRKLLQGSAVLNIGAVVDPIPVAQPAIV